VMIVDKHIDLNVYKEGTDWLDEEELQTAESKAGGGENMQISPRCGTSNEEKKAGCGIASASGAEFSKLIAETDFNEWVAHLMFMPSRVSDVGQDFLGREVMKIIFKRKDGELVVGCLASKKNHVYLSYIPDST